MRGKLPTPAQRRLLVNLAAGRSPAAGLSGTSAHGGLAVTISVCLRRGWIDRETEITEVGRLALAEAERDPQRRAS